jgi:hypothetical protein
MPGSGTPGPHQPRPQEAKHPRGFKHARETNLRRLLTLLRQEKRPPVVGSVIRAPLAPREQAAVIQRSPVPAAPRAVLITAPPITPRGQMIQEPRVSLCVGHSPLPIVGCLAFTLSLPQLYGDFTEPKGAIHDPRFIRAPTLRRGNRRGRKTEAALALG